MIDILTILKGKLYKISRLNDKLMGKLKAKDKEVTELQIELEFEKSNNMILMLDKLPF